MATVGEAFDLAVSQYQAGQMEMAASICRQILAAAPDQPETLHLLGVIELGAGRHVEAQQLIERAIACEGGNPSFHLNLGIVFKALGKVERAIEAYRQAVELDGQFAEALTNLCNVLWEEGRMAEAIDVGRRAVQAKPDLPQAHNNLANALKARGEVDDAVEHYRKAIQLNPESASVHRNYGNLLNVTGQTAEAIEVLRRAVALDGNAPGNYVGLSLAYAEAGLLDDARDAATKAMAIDPDSTDALIAMGNILKDLGKPHEAIEHYQRAGRLAPDRQIAHQNLLFTLNYLWDVEPVDVMARHVQWGRQVIAASPRTMKHGNDRDPHRRLRIGYVSPDFRRHPVACFLLPILDNHRAEEVEVFCYAQVLNVDDVTERSRGACDHWINTCGLRDDELAQRIAADRIDILVDLGGHTENARLTVFARKPAPVQVAYLGYSNTTGLETIDYRLTDDAGDPEDQSTPYVEQVVRLDAGFCVYEPPPQAPPVAPLPAEENGCITFGSLTNPAKLNANVYDLWSRLLQDVPGSRLYMNRDSFRGRVRDDLIAAFTDRGIEADRIIVEHDAPQAGRIAAYNRIDIALDPFPYTGHTTNCEALWMGVPVVALRGRTLIARQSATILEAADCARWLADSPEGYLEVAKDLAGDVERLAAIRRELRRRVGKSRLCDAPGFTQCLERTYRMLWRRWCAAQ